jgi:hypothetical protein
MRARFPASAIRGRWGAAGNTTTPKEEVMSRSWDEVRAEAEAAGKLNPRRPDYRTRELIRDQDRRNATYAAPARDYTVAWFVIAMALALLADALLGAGALYLILKAVG